MEQGLRRYAGARPRALSFCAHAILGEGLMEVEDARLDPRFDTR
ncbi:MAG: hypothetical protein U1E77_03095 [Inhella sp.]